MPGTLDIIVVGGGAAGLTAARILSSRDARVLLLEGRQRLGGRISTLRAADLSLPIEAGAEFVHGLPESTWQIIRAGALPVAELPDTHAQYFDGRLILQQDFWREAEVLLQKLSRLRGDVLTFAGFLDTYARRSPQRLRELVTGYVEGFNAADARRISAKAVWEAETAQEKVQAQRSFRLTCGYDRLIGWLAAGLAPGRCEIRLGRCVDEIRWRAGRVQVTAGQERFTAGQCLLTLPLSLLKAASGAAVIRFIPEITPIRRAAASMEMGSVVKLAMVFRESFWEGRLKTLPATATLRDTLFVHGLPADLPFPTWWSMLPFRTPVLMGWAGGPAAARLSGRFAADIERAGIASLSRLTGVSGPRIASLLVRSHPFDWQSDPFSRGAYSYVLPGGLRSPEVLARPLAKTLFFAGEATDPDNFGTVAGAITSGQRAAEQVLRST